MDAATHAIDHDPAHVLNLVKDVEVHSRQLVWVYLETSPALDITAHGKTFRPDRLHITYVRLNGVWTCDGWVILGPRPGALVQNNISADISSLQGITPEWVTVLIAEHTPTLTEA